MFCRKCGKELEGSTRFCSGCGSPVLPPQRPDVSQKSDNAMIKAMIACLCVLLIVVIGIFIWLLVSFYEKAPEENESSAAVLKNEDFASKNLIDNEEEEVSVEHTEYSEDVVAEKSADNADMEIYEDTDGDALQKKDFLTVLGNDSEDADAIHEYKIVIGDMTWSDAFHGSLSYKNGYLVHINSQQEMDHIIHMIEQQGYEDYVFWIGAKREEDSKEYHWVNSEMRLVGDVLNHDPNWLQIVSDDGTVTQEPSFWGDSNEDETCVDMFRRNGEWVWNDVQNDLPALNLYNGKIGYIVEIESET